MRRSLAILAICALCYACGRTAPAPAVNAQPTGEITRAESLVDLVLDTYTAPEPVERRVQLASYSEFEVMLARAIADRSPWHEWLDQYKRSAVIVFGYSDRRLADQRILSMVIWNRGADETVVHETLHYIHWHQSTLPQYLTDTEEQVDRATSNFMTSPIYKAWLRERG